MDELKLSDLDGIRIRDLNLEELNELYCRLETLHDVIDALEPDDNDLESDEYASWMEDLESVDDFMDDVRDRIESLSSEEFGTEDL